MRSLAEILIDALTAAPSDVPICYVHENMTQVRRVKAGTNVTIGIPAHVFTPDDAMWFTAEGRPTARRPKYVGMVVFVPIEFHEGGK